MHRVLSYSRQYLYLYRHWEAQNSLISYLQRVGQRCQEDDNACLSHGRLATLFPQQKMVAMKILQEPFLLLQGGPGTGKTHTVATTLAHWLAHEEVGGKLLITAPTGKAVAHLHATLLSYLPTGSAEHHRIECGTLHRILNKYRQSPMEVDLVIIDESSMVELEILALFVQKLPATARLIMVGDYNQLPPVDGGNPFEQMVHWAQKEKMQWLSQLNQSVRVEDSPLLDFARLILEGRSDDALECILDKTKSLELITTNFSDLMGIGYQYGERAGHINPLIERLIEPYIVEGTDRYHQRCIEQLQLFRVLSSLRQGPWGAEGINEAILHAIGRKSQRQKEWIIPILIKENRPELDLYNGDHGYLLHSYEGGLSAQTLHLGHNTFLFPSKGNKDPEALRRIPPYLIGDYELAYCISIHKSQGSEFLEVSLILPEGSERFGRQLLYTGVTRAKKRLKLYTSHHTLTKTIQNRVARPPSLMEELRYNFKDL
jgi:exodeoxyribonuclease V alpha subunit